MDRLTIKIAGVVQLTPNREEITNKLAHYEDLEEQGRLVEVVRCYECVFKDGIECNIWGAGTRAANFCGRGRRKEEQNG